MAGTLTPNGDHFQAVINDLELDPILLNFYDDYFVEIDVSDYKYLHLSEDGLQDIIDLLRKAQQEFNK